MYKNDSDLFFCCSLIEFIGRECKLKRVDVVKKLGEECIRRIYENADILHCEPIEKTADVYINMFDIGQGDYDNVSLCKYEVPDYWAIGEVYARVIEDNVVIPDSSLKPEVDEVVKILFDVYSSFISDSISNYNSDFFYQSREYISVCYQSGQVV